MLELALLLSSFIFLLLSFAFLLLLAFDFFKKHYDKVKQEVSELERLNNNLQELLKQYEENEEITFN